MDISYILNPLNDAQRQAVTSEVTHTLVLAGAGSGKTLVLVHRIAWVIATEGINPWNILSVTFTNKAAKEMQHRLEVLLETSLHNTWVGTFHGLAYRFLRAHWQEAKLPQNFQILDSSDQRRSIKKVIKDLGFDDKKYPSKQVQWQINNWKDDGLKAKNIILENDDIYYKNVLKIYQFYEQQNQSAGLVDFADLLLKTFETMRDNAGILTHYQQRFKHILIDEFQDTNTIQHKWIRLLAGNNNSIFVVGDDDQSIYGWRGAKISNIIDFPKHFKQCTTYKLEQNYRSTGNILNAANTIIANNLQRIGKNLWTDGNDGDLIKLYQAYNDLDEADFVINTINLLHSQNINLDEIAILYRSNAQSRLFEQNLIKHKIPYQVYGGLRFFERAEIKDALAYLRLISNPHDNIAFERVVNRPTRGIGNQSIEHIQLLARDNACSLWQAARYFIELNNVTKRAINAVDGFLLLIAKLKSDITELSLAEKTEHILDTTGLLDLYKNDKSQDKAEIKVDNLYELINACKQFERFDKDIDELDDFLAQSVLDMDNNQNETWQHCIQLMTLHSAKGLEFEVVFLTGLEEGLFPHRMSSGDEFGLDEERRLCYVGVTRAKQKLFLSFADNRRIYGDIQAQQPSRFILEIPQKFIHSIKIPESNFLDIPISAKAEVTQMSDNFNLGQLVQHTSFGTGVIINAEGSGEHARVQINFNDVGNKWLVVAYANLTLVE